MLSSIFFLAAKIFPWWAIPVGGVFTQLGIYRRRRGRSSQWIFFGVAGLFFLAALAWIGLRGDVHAENWARSLFG